MIPTSVPADLCNMDVPCRGAFCRARPADFQGAYGEAATGATMATSDHNEATGGPLIMATHITRRAITSSVMAGAAAIPASSLPAVALTSKIIRCGNRQGRLYGSVCHRTWYPDGD